MKWITVVVCYFAIYDQAYIE
ncbi:Protein of unknown function [Bacillus cytotoxicus]|uniref:Uncharacterized protein n=1 Tax=Bacillus cytotoxicus TaxID=580165 RepID=A0AAX2CDR0_9BACI|nr:Protein of unknown function [Bacillus cytotoxicus]